MMRGAGQVVFVGALALGALAPGATARPLWGAAVHGLPTAALEDSRAVAPDPAPPDDGPERVLIDNRLRARTVRVVGLDDTTVSYIDAGGLIRSEPFSEFVALLPADGTVPPPPIVGLWLADGQRLAGDLRGGDAVEGLVRWAHPALGVLDVSLEFLAVARLLRAGETTREPASTVPLDADAVVLTNGDLVTGFVQSIGATTKVETGGAVREVERERIARVHIANPPGLPSGSAVWLADGSIVVVGGIHTGPTGVVRLHPALDKSAPAGSEGSAVGVGREDLRLANIVAVAFDAARIVPLSGIAPAEQRAIGRDWAAPLIAGGGDVLWAADLSMPGPMSVSWDVPAGRLWMTAELPADMWTWGDCELVVSVGGAEAKRTRLWAEHAAEDVVVDLPSAGRLTITLEPGRYGAIQDRVVLRRAVVVRE